MWAGALSSFKIHNSGCFFLTQNLFIILLDNCLTTGYSFYRNDVLDIEEDDKYCLELMCAFFALGEDGIFQCKDCFLVYVNIHVSSTLFKKLGSPSVRSKRSKQISFLLSFCLFDKTFGFKMRGTLSLFICNISSTARTFNLCSFRIASRTFAMFSAVVDDCGQPRGSSSFTGLLSSENFLWYSKTHRHELLTFGKSALLTWRFTTRKNTTKFEAVDKASCKFVTAWDYNSRSNMVHAPSYNTKNSSLAMRTVKLSLCQISCIHKKKIVLVIVNETHYMILLYLNIYPHWKKIK